jgi:hypothetical protein
MCNFITLGRLKPLPQIGEASSPRCPLTSPGGSIQVRSPEKGFGVGLKDERGYRYQTPFGKK